MKREPTKEEIRQRRIEHLKWLRDHYRKMELGSSREERLALKAQQMLLQKRAEQIERGDR